MSPPTLSPATAPEPQTVELALKYLDFAMKTVSSIPGFSGERHKLESFCKQMDLAAAMLKGITMNDDARRCLNLQFINKISEDIQIEARINATMDWPEAKKRLKEKYGDFRRPLTGHIWKVISLERRRGEGMTAYAGRLTDEMKTLIRRIGEGGYNEPEKLARCSAYEELAVDTLRRNLTERMRDVTRGENTLEGIRNRLEDEEMTVQDCKPSQSDWVEVRRKVPRPAPAPVIPFPRRWEPMESRRPRQPPPSAERRPRRTAETFKRSRPQADERPTKRYAPVRRCWECGDETHISRNCPYMFRRREREQQAYYGEPMDINALRRWNRERRGESQDEMGGYCSEGSVYSAASAGPGWESGHWKPEDKRRNTAPHQVKSTETTENPEVAA